MHMVYQILSNAARRSGEPALSSVRTDYCRGRDERGHNPRLETGAECGATASMARDSVVNMYKSAAGSHPPRCSQEEDTSSLEVCPYRSPT
jgi:hypothetical protein